mmetsp:Transcript_49341/g.123331  ORF Transcript_49341/g.123331 Transcript_49341/m.123331 type:complete len:302 (+) Transcript_49341:688-1593(+)
MSHPCSKITDLVMQRDFRADTAVLAFRHVVVFDLIGSEVWNLPLQRLIVVCKSVGMPHLPQLNVLLLLLQLPCLFSILDPNKQLLRFLEFRLLRLEVRHSCLAGAIPGLAKVLVCQVLLHILERVPCSSQVKLDSKAPQNPIQGIVVLGQALAPRIDSVLANPLRRAPGTVEQLLHHLWRRKVCPVPIAVLLGPCHPRLLRLLLGDVAPLQRRDRGAGDVRVVCDDDLEAREGLLLGKHLARLLVGHRPRGLKRALVRERLQQHRLALVWVELLVPHPVRLPPGVCNLLREAAQHLTLDDG